MSDPDFDSLPYEAALADLTAAKGAWARLAIPDRVRLLDEVRAATAAVAGDWVSLACVAKGVAPDSPAAGEDWLGGPWALIASARTLADNLRTRPVLSHRRTVTGQVAVRGYPRSVWDRIVMNGVRAEVWMEPGVTAADLPGLTAVAYADGADRTGRLALVLGAGNVSSIGPLDAIHKLFNENQVVILKLNPVNDYLAPVLERALRPLIAAGGLRIVTGGGAVGAWLARHPAVEAIHITGARATHDRIVWGEGSEAEARRAEGRPLNARPLTSELGAVCPTIVVPGPWSAADIAFQAEQLVTQKLQNSGFNCIAMQVLILPDGWEGTAPLLSALRARVRGVGPRPAYYPGTEARLQDFAEVAGAVEHWPRGGGGAPDLVVAEAADIGGAGQVEVFGPALTVLRLHAPDPEAFLAAAITLANDRLYGTLGANILIHPRTRRQIGRAAFERLVAGLRYGAIAINGWTGVAYALPTLPWGGFRGGPTPPTIADAQSGVGTVHNTLLLEGTERAIVEAPFRPFPRSLTLWPPALLPRPPWFVTHPRAALIGRLLTRFEARPGLGRLWPLLVQSLRRGPPADAA